jgi:signal transduction histidine kinase
MHYAGMAAATFVPGSVCTAGPPAVYPEGLAGTIAGFALAFQALTLCVSATHAYSADRVSRHSRRQLIEAQEFERRRMSRELHDRVGQNLTALDINLDILKESVPRDDAIRARIDDSIALVATTADAIDNVMSDLRPPMLDDHGLAAALQWYAEQFSARTGTGVEVKAAPGPRPAPEVEIAMFRIAQEALTNVARHARATRAQIVFERAADRCILTISDNGIGFDRDGAGEGRGLAIMAERAQAMGGEVDLHSEPGRGTRVTASLPC